MTPAPTPRSMAVDTGAVVVLAAIALLGLDDSYSSRAYLVTGGAAVLAVTGWALLCTVRRSGAGVFLLVASIGFPLLGATVVVHNFDWLGFPALQAVTDVLPAVITAPTEFLTTIPPVDASGTVLAIPYVAGYLGAGAAAWAALRTRRPLLPVAPMVLVMAACIALGTEEPPALLVRAALFAVVAVLWVGVRAARLQVVEHAARGRTLRAVAATTVAVGAVLLSSLWLPSVPGPDRVVLRGRVGSGQDVSQLDNPLAGFRKFTPQPAGTPDNVAGKRLLRVTGLPRRDVVRIVALDTYDGTTWDAGNRTVTDDNASLFQRIGQRVGAREPGRRIRVGVEVKKAWTSSWLPLAGQLTSIDFDYLDGRAQRSEVRYDVATQTGMVVGGLENKDDYHFTATVPASALLRTATPYGSGAPLQPAGAFLDRYLVPWKHSGLRPMAQVFSVARYLRVNGRYSDGAGRSERAYLPGQSELRLGPNFFGARAIVGDDEQYAAFMALAANRLGVPARVVVGARPARNGWVRGRDVFAWVEVRLSDGTWRTLPTRLFMSHKPPRRTEDRQSPASFVRHGSQGGGRDTQQPPQVQRPQAHRPRTEQRGSRWWTWAVPSVVLLLAAVPVAKQLRRRRRRSRGAPSARFVGGWAEVLDLVRDTARDVPSGLARTEQARRLGLSVELARAADEHVFAPAEPSVRAAQEFWRAVGAERRRVGSQVGAVRRVLAVWNPRSLLPRSRLKGW